ncbi:MAG: heavy-metal-associated domain-containing protein [Microbacterium sp.]
MCGTTTTRNDLGLTEKNSGCACGGHSHMQSDVQGHEQAGDVFREHYSVNGMTCGHCVSSVTEELSGLEGVQSVSVDLNAGGASRVMVVSSRPVPAEAVRAAVSEAGYDLVTADR